METRHGIEQEKCNWNSRKTNKKDITTIKYSFEIQLTHKEKYSLHVVICIYCIAFPVSWIEMSSTYPVVEKIEGSKGGIRRRRTDTRKGEKKNKRTNNDLQNTTRKT